MIENISVENEVFGLRLRIRKWGGWSEGIRLGIREEERREKRVQKTK